jgi:type IV secretory pathway VirB9-like protein
MHRFLVLLCLARLDSAGEPPSEQTQTLTVHAEDIIPLHASVKETTLIVLPATEKVMGVFCGDKAYWSVDVIPGAERYVAVKPSKGGIATDIHIVTDHNNSYTLKAAEGGAGPVDVKLFLQPADVSSLERPPVFVPAAEAERLKALVTEAQAELKKAQLAAKTEVQSKVEQHIADYPDQMKFTYSFRRDKPPFNVDSIWHDDRFTYIRAHPLEAPALYELKDGKPNLIPFEMKPDGLYFVPKILDTAYLQIGKQRLDIGK